jgi:hypothetical protein
LRFGWASPAIRELCLSEDGLRLAIPAGVGDAQLLLQVVHHSPTFGHLQSLAVVRFAVDGHPNGETARVGVALGGANLSGVPLVEGRAVMLANGVAAAVGIADAFYVEELRINGRLLSHAAS